MPSSDLALFSLLQAYSALKHPRFLSFPTHLAFLQVHDFLLSSILLNPHLLQYPPSHTYQLSFWKWAIEHLEKLLGDEAGVPLLFTSVCQLRLRRKVLRSTNVCMTDWFR
jgi:hypothetical protein